MCAMVKSRYIGDGKPPTFNRNPYNGYINPYYWVDDHPLLYGKQWEFRPWHMCIVYIFKLLQSFIVHEFSNLKTGLANFLLPRPTPFQPPTFLAQLEGSSQLMTMVIVGTSPKDWGGAPLAKWLITWLKSMGVRCLITRKNLSWYPILPTPNTAPFPPSQTTTPTT